MLYNIKCLFHNSTAVYTIISVCHSWQAFWPLNLKLQILKENPKKNNNVCYQKAEWKNYFVRMSITLSFLSTNSEMQFAKKIFENLIILCNFLNPLTHGEGRCTPLPLLFFFFVFYSKKIVLTPLKALLFRKNLPLFSCQQICSQSWVKYIYVISCP